MMIQDHILHHTAGYLYWKSKQGRYLGCNSNFAKLLGMQHPGEILDKTDHALFAKQLDKQTLDMRWTIESRVMANDTIETVEETNVDSQGNVRCLLAEKRPLKDSNGEIIGLLTSAIEITEQKNAQLAKTEFIANMSHDLRTP